MTICKMEGRNSQRTHSALHSISMFQFKTLKFFYLSICLMVKFNGLQCDEIFSMSDIIFCDNSGLKGFRFDAPVLEVRNVSSQSACIKECTTRPCCRSMNYERATSTNHPNKCELLHYFLDNTSFVLEINSSYEYLFLDEPLKEYNASCIREEQQKHENESMSWTLECSSFPCLNNGSCVVNGSTGYLCTCLPGYSGTHCEKTHNSCKDVLKNNGAASDGVYYLKSNENSEMYPVYCRMSSLSSKCGGGGWTLVMKLDRDKTTFKYNSLFWTNMETLNVNVGPDGLAQNETKLASYHNTPLTKVCLGMSRNGVTNWILVNHAATSLFSVIADGSYHATSVGKDEWESLIHGSSVQPHYNKEGFNVKFSHDNLKLRIGVAGENYRQYCERCDSVIGFGIAMSDWKWSSGNIRRYKSEGVLGVKILTTFGYIFVQ